jgi:hypothetical protein
VRTPCRSGVPADRPRHSATAAGPAGSHRWFPGGRGSFSQGGPGGEEPAGSRTGRPDRPGANGAFACPGTSWSPEPALRSPEPSLASSPGPALLLARAHLCVHAPPLSSLSSALPRMRPGRPKTAFACGVPGALRGTWVSPTGFDEDERPVSRERLDMRGTHSHEASSWARGYYAE